jgi:hypothetical protein
LYKPGGFFFAFLLRKVFTQVFTGSGLGRNRIALGAYWRDDEHQLWQQALLIVSEGALNPTTTSDRLKLVRYLPLHLRYAVGIACVARRQFASMHSVAEILVPIGSRQREHLLLEITSSDGLRSDLTQALHHRQREFYTPGSGRSEIENQIKAELTSQKELWLPLRSGLFGGSIERAQAAHQKAQEELKTRLP